MTLSWRLLRFRARLAPRSLASLQHHSHSELRSNPSLDSIRSLASPIHTRSLHHGTFSHSQTHFSCRFADSKNSRNQTIRRFSSEPEVETSDSGLSVVSEIFSEPRDSEEIRKHLGDNNIVISYDRVLLIFEKLESCPEVSRRFFDWLLENKEKRFLSSKCHNLMLRNLGVNGNVDEFWGFLEAMNKKGYGISKFVRDRVLERFMKEGSIGDVKKLKHVYDSGSIDRSDEKIALIACRIIQKEVWSSDVEKRLRDLKAKFSSNMVAGVLHGLRRDPTKALIYFRWLEEESDLFKHDEKTYNTMAKVLGRKDCVDQFWKVIDEMKSFEFKMDLSVFHYVVGQFLKTRMTEDAVNLYEFAVAGPDNKLSIGFGVFLLQKIAAARKFDVDIFSKAVRVFTENGNALTDSMLESILKTLKRVGESPKVLKAAEECGYIANGSIRSKIVALLCSSKKSNEAIKFVEESAEQDLSVWKSLIQGLSEIGDLEIASKCIRMMIESQGAESASSALQPVILAYCSRKNPTGAYELLHDLVIEKHAKPSPKMCRMVITDLLKQGSFSEALNVLVFMKEHEFPPYLDPFIGYISKSGKADEADAFLRATSKRVAPMALFQRVFEAYFEAGRRDEAQDLLAKCPRFIQDHPDVLNLFALAA